MANAIFEEKNISGVDSKPRAIIPDDSKLFAQADCDITIMHHTTCGVKSSSKV